MMFLGTSARGQEKIVPAKGVFLVAKNEIEGGPFYQSVVLLLAHSDKGTIGAHRQPDDGNSSFESAAGPRRETSHELYFGGPVELSGLLYLFRSSERPEQVDEASHVMADVYYSGDRELLEESHGRRQEAGQKERRAPFVHRALRVGAGSAGHGARSWIVGPRACGCVHGLRQGSGDDVARAVERQPRHRSFFTTFASFVTKTTRRSAVMSSSGLPSTAMRSAAIPFSRAPMESPSSRDSAARQARRARERRGHSQQNEPRWRKPRRRQLVGASVAEIKAPNRPVPDQEPNEPKQHRPREARHSPAAAAQDIGHGYGLGHGHERGARSCLL